MTTTMGSIAELATEYAESRSPSALERLRDAVRRSPGFRVDLDIARETAALSRRGDHAEVVVLVQGHLPGAFFGPATHAVLATAFAGLGDAARAERERRIAQLALSSILGTGDGTRERPWTVLRLSDEYDVLQSQGRRSRRVALVVEDGRPLDRHECEDGSTAWFDPGYDPTAAARSPQ